MSICSFSIDLDLLANSECLDIAKDDGLSSGVGISITCRDSQITNPISAFYGEENLEKEEAALIISLNDFVISLFFIIVIWILSSRTASETK